jgi:hypothetical protein
MARLDDGGRQERVQKGTDEVEIVAQHGLY